nr:MAG TPA: hypothetical protein [Caudoviricetes sp.]
MNNRFARKQFRFLREPLPLLRGGCHIQLCCNLSRSFDRISRSRVCSACSRWSRS